MWLAQLYRHIGSANELRLPLRVGRHFVLARALTLGTLAPCSFHAERLTEVVLMTRNPGHQLRWLGIRIAVNTVHPEYSKIKNVDSV